MDVILGLVALFWPVILMGAAIAVAEAIERRARFRLRTLLIVTTLVAIVLGGIAASR